MVSAGQMPNLITVQQKRGDMVAKIFIKRKFKKDSGREIVAILNKMRAAAMDQPGYISGETLMDYDNPQSVAVIATWQSMENWHAWKENPERMKIESMLEAFQVGPTEFEEYVSGTTYRP
jgi:heme-degrading monooxygenase HmoA